MISKTAVSELKMFFKRATGIDLPAISDNGLTYQAGQQYIS